MRNLITSLLLISPILVISGCGITSHGFDGNIQGKNLKTPWGECEDCTMTIHSSWGKCNAVNK